MERLNGAQSAEHEAKWDWRAGNEPPPMSAHTIHTFIMLWHVDSGSPTKLVPLIDMIWSPMFSLPDLSAGPACIMLAIMTVGRMEPHPLSTMTTPRISPLAFSTNTCGHSRQSTGRETKTNHFKLHFIGIHLSELSWKKDAILICHSNLYYIFSSSDVIMPTCGWKAE